MELVLGMGLGLACGVTLRSALQRDIDPFTEKVIHSYVYIFIYTYRYIYEHVNTRLRFRGRSTLLPKK